jgi:hypothetical protein
MTPRIRAAVANGIIGIKYGTLIEIMSAQGWAQLGWPPSHHPKCDPGDLDNFHHILHANLIGDFVKPLPYGVF